jgi:uncharacterized protein (TIGR02646 family)
LIHVCLESCPAGAERALDELATFQHEVDPGSSYRAQVEAAAAAWKKRRRGRVMRTIRAMLRAMCSGVRCCMFCEVPAASHVEHFRPKGRYPELAFAWANFLYSCSLCNERKGSVFKILRPDGGIVRLSARRRAPPAGEPLLLDPRHDDPLAFLELDLGTGLFLERHPRGSVGFKRAAFTVEALGLNDREDLAEMRRTMLLTYSALLGRYVSRQRAGAEQRELDRLVMAIRRNNHRAVWEEMKRQRGGIPVLLELFSAAPEALVW